MTAKTSYLRALLTALPLITGAATAKAEDNSSINRVDVTGRTAHFVKFDVRNSCPNLASSLKENLSRLVDREEKYGEVLVEFKLMGHSVGDVRTTGALRDYNNPIKRVVRNAECKDTAGVEQIYRFIVAFVPPKDAGGADQVVALLPQ